MTAKEKEIALPIGVAADGEPVLLPDDAVTQGFAILARRRSGKSTLAGVMEETFCQRGDPWVALDPVSAHWGILYRDAAGRPGTPSGHDVLIVGGKQGHVPLDEHAGAQLAEIIVDTNISCIIDLADESMNATQRFVADFANALLKLNETPRHVLLEEAHEFVPQQLVWDNQKLVRGAVSRLIRNGGGRGIGFTLVTQRPAAVAKDVLEMIDNLFILRMSGPNDLKAVQLWFEHNVSDPAELAAILRSLPGFKPGEAWLCSPDWLGKITRLRVRERATYHAGRTPKKGERPVAPRRVELGKVIEQFRAAAARRHIAVQQDRDLKAENVALRQRVTALEKGRAAAAPAAPDQRVVERTVATALAGERRARQQHDRFIAGLVRHAEQAAHPLRSALGALDGLEGSLARLRQALNGTYASANGGAGGVGDAAGPTGADRAAQAVGDAPPKPGRRELRAGAALAPPAERASSPPRSDAPVGPAASWPTDGLGDLPAGSMRLLRALAARHPLSWTQRQLGSLCGYPHTKSTYRTYRSRLTARGLIERAGQDVRITEAGLALVGDSVPEAPTDHAAAMAMWRAKLPAGSYAMLEAVVAAGPDGLTQDEMAARAGYDPETSTYRTYRSRLTSNGLIELLGDVARATDVLYPEGA